nr:polyketide synthase dehydratase domain-containing protein [uncultured Clostridium sp.]
MLSLDGQCKTFDKEANGYVPGDGAAVLLLQRLEDAVKDCNHIYGVIKGIAVNHNGKSFSMTAPSVEAQYDVILKAYKDAEISPMSVNYVEAHGTGTSLGDPIEVEALTRVFRGYTEKKQFCRIGSVKSNIGHLEAAAGMAGIIKVLLMLKWKKIPMTCNVSSLNPVIDFSLTPFIVATQLSEWKRIDAATPLRAGISCFGFGGVNSHLLMEEYETTNDWEEVDKEIDYIFTLSANTHSGLEQLIQEWLNYIKEEEFSRQTLRDICCTLFCGRESFTYRVGFVIKTKEELAKNLINCKREIHTNEKIPWCLCFGKLELNGYADIDNQVADQKIVQEILKFIWERFEKAEDGKRLEQDFYKAIWEEKDKKVYQFLAGYAYAMFLKRIGFQPDILMGEKEGIWIALAVCEILDAVDVISVLGGIKSAESLKFYRPSIPFYDQLSKRMWMPLHFDENYIHYLFDDLNLIKLLESQICHNSYSLDSPFGLNCGLMEYQSRAIALYKNQYTFKKYLKEWFNLTRKLTEFDLEQLFLEEIVPLPERGEPSSKWMLLIIAVEVSLNKLNQRWNITTYESFKNEKFTELMELISAEVIPKEMIIEILIKDRIEEKAILSILNERQSKITTLKSCSFIKQRSPYLEELEEKTNWLKKSIESEISSVPYKQMQLVTNIHESTFSYVSKNNIVQFGNEKSGSAVLQLWLRGVNIKWGNLIGKKEFHRISLPKTCFQRKRFYGKEEAIYESKEIIKEESRDKEKCRSIISDGNEFYYTDHVFCGKKTLPAVLYIEFIREMGADTTPPIIFKLRNLTWTRAIHITDHSQKINFNFEKKEHLTSYQVWTYNDQEEKVVHSQGFFEVLSENNDVKPTMPLADIIEKCSQVIEGAEVYKALFELGFDYGVSFQSIQEIRFHELEALVHIILPEKIKENKQEFYLHPSVMDGAFQAAVFFARQWSDGKSFMPFSIREILIMDKVVNDSYAHLECRKQGEDNFIFNIKISDGQGRILIIIKELCIQAVKIPGYQKDEKLKRLLKKLESGESSISEVKKMMEVLG